MYMILPVHMKVWFMQNYILYETYDCVLQYVQFSAYSHNFRTNNIFSLLISATLHYLIAYLLYYNIYIFYISTVISLSFPEDTLGTSSYFISFHMSYNSLTFSIIFN